MTTVSSKPIVISAHTLGTVSGDELLARLGASDVTFDLSTSFRVDAYNSLILACALSRVPRQITLRIGAQGITGGLEESLSRSCLGPLLWRSIRPASGAASSDSLTSKPLAFADPERNLFAISSSLLDRKTYAGFQNDLSTCMRAAKITIDEHLASLVAALTYEANTNAEEHGSTRLTDAKVFDTRTVFRCFVMRLHDEPSTTLSPAARAYVASYQQSFSKRTRWLEVVIGDAGMGMAYPRFLVRAQSLRSSISDLYLASFHAEMAQIEEVLTRAVSTKGYWGHIESSYGSVGSGTGLMRRRLADLRAFGAVRAGRCLATIAFPHAEISQSAVRSTDYSVEAGELPLFGGTVWHFLIPLDQQRQLL